MSLSTPPLPEPHGGSTGFALSIPRAAVWCPLSEHHTEQDEQPPLIGQCPYCGRVNFVPPAPFNAYVLRGVKRIARVGQVVRGYLAGSTSRTCAACARAVIQQWEATRDGRH